MVEILRLPLQSSGDVAAARQLTCELAREVGMANLEKTKLATVVSGLARRCLASAGSGEVTFSLDEAEGSGRLVVAVSDAGDGTWETGEVEAGLPASRASRGLDIPSLRRLVDDFEHAAQPDGSTSVTAAIRLSAQATRDIGLARRLTALRPEASLLAAPAGSTRPVDPAALLAAHSKVLELTMAELKWANDERLAVNAELALTNRGVLDLVAELSMANDALTTTGASLEAIIATASDGFVSMSSDGLISEWNQRAEALFGWSRDEVMGRELVELIIPESEQDASRTCLRGVLDDRNASVNDQIIELAAIHRDGRQIPVELALWRVSSGQGEQMSAFIRDVTERQQIAKDVATARDQAVEASRLKSLFLATMSHEIRTPMNGVIGLTGLLLQDELKDSQRRYAEGIMVAGNALLAVINDILDFSKIEAGALILDDAPVRLGELLEDVVDMVSQSALAKGLELVGYCDATVPAMLRGDPVRIRQILLNLASNAVKFTSHGEISLSIRLGSDSAGLGPDPILDPETARIRFEVTDTGVGIAEADRTRLFDPFAQADASTTREFGGTGLGLAISRELAEAMGGQLGVDSQPGAGSTFWCELPLRVDSAGGEVPASADPALAGKRVLVIDENSTVRTVLTRHLSSWAMIPTAFESADRALEHLTDGSAPDLAYDLGIISMRLSGIDGLELAARIRTQMGVPSFPVVLVTSDAAVELEAARDAGIVSFLDKPIQQSRLYDCLLQLVGGNTDVPPRRSARSWTAKTPAVAHLGRLLLVEDNEINQMVAVGILTKLGYTVDIANDGLEALDLADASTYQAVLMDLQMPNMDGFEATGEFRRREAAAEGLSESGERTVRPPLPIIAMTAAVMKEDRDRCLAAGMDDYLTKPIHIPELAAVLTRWITAAGAPPSGFRTSDPITRNSILERVDELRDNGAADLTCPLITSFLTRAPIALLELTDTFRRDDLEAFTHAVHSLNGAAGNLGANGMSNLCARMETLSRNGERQPLPHLLSRLYVEYDHVRHIFEAVLADAKATDV